MSGFIGCMYEESSEGTRLDEQQFNKMVEIIQHRGPDGEAFKQNDHLYFGSKQLQVFNVNESLMYENDNYWIVCSGQIYNMPTLKEKLTDKGVTLSEGSDMEVIVSLYNDLQEKVFDELRGMFAFVIWDKAKQQLFGARDHFGIEPFFYLETEGVSFFASEKKSIVLALEETKLNVDSLQQYMTYQFVPEPKTMTARIKKLEPGHYFIKKLGEPLQIKRYWKANFLPAHRPEDELVQDIRNTLIESVQLHMRSDVPVGSFLSGGIDSSFIASIAKQFKPDIKTFSVGFERDGFSEIDVAKETADKLGLENISYVISPQEYMEELPKIMWMMDDPLADPACVPLYFVAREARKHVNVALSGEGADELFGGYNIYREPQSLEVFDKIPEVGKALLRQLAKAFPEGVKGKSFIERGLTPMEERYIGNAKMFSEEEKQKLLRQYNAAVDYRDVTKPLYAETTGYGPVERMQYIDIHTWMRGDILLKADRMTMAHSLQVRVPFLDKHLFDLASTIPASLKTAHGTTKYVLRKAAEGIVPDHVLNRKKLGFPVPIRHWLKDEMHDWAKEIIKLSETDHLLDKQYVLKLLEDHCQGKMDYSRKIWTVLVFMIWHAVYVEERYDFQKKYKAAPLHS